MIVYVIAATYVDGAHQVFLGQAYEETVELLKDLVGGPHETERREQHGRIPAEPASNELVKWRKASQAYKRQYAFDDVVVQAVVRGRRIIFGSVGISHHRLGKLGKKPAEQSVYIHFRCIFLLYGLLVLMRVPVSGIRSEQ